MNTIQKTIDGITINVPVGSMDPPTELGRMVFESMCDPENWKCPTRPAEVAPSVADEVAYALDWYLGGHERSETVRSDGHRSITLTSKGYYHYIGA